MKLLTTRYLEIRWEPRWPAFAIGFYGAWGRHTFVILAAPLVIEIGERV